MKDQQTDTGIRVNTSEIVPSADGYVRLTLDTLLTIRFSHLISGVYEDTSISAGEGASFSVTYGYTEWVSTAKPLLSLGWNWRLGVSQGPIQYSRMDCPYSNIMLVDERLHDLGAAKTAALLESIIDLMHWQTEVDEHIVARYA